MRQNGLELFNNYCLLERHIMIFIYHGHTPRFQLSKAGHSLPLSTGVVDKEMKWLWNVARIGNRVQYIVELSSMIKSVIYMYA